MRNQTKQGHDKLLTVHNIAYIAVMTAVLEAVKIALNSIPNVELVTLLIIIYTLQFGWKISIIVSLLFAFIECLIWGFGTWSIVYFYMWPLLILLTNAFRKSQSPMVFILLSAAFGFAFGALCSIATIFIGGFKMALTWWISGIPYDLIHGFSNLIISAVLFNPINNSLAKLKTTK